MGLKTTGDNVPDFDKDKALKRRFEIGAKTLELIQGMTFLRLVPHDFDSALRHIKTLRSGHVTSLALKADEIKNALLSFMETSGDKNFARWREFFIHDVAEIAKLYAETERASGILLSLHAAFEPVQPFLPHGG